MNVIHIATESDALLVNLVAETLGKGSNNLSVELVNVNGSKYLGCHSSAWTKEDFEAFQARAFADLCSKDQLDALDRLYESAMTTSDDYNSINYWNSKLEEWGLSQVEQE